MLVGRQATSSSEGPDPQRYREMEQELPRARKKIDALQAELEMVRTRYAVDREALEMVREEIAKQKEKIASLEEGIRFYRDLMAPGEIAEGLSLREPELVARDDPSTYAFRLVAQQEARKHELLKGELHVEVFGEQAGESVSYPLARLSDDVEDEVVALRFRYFQSLEGELTLPADFDPRGISVVATVTSPRKSEVRERFPWHVQERFTHVGR